MLEAPRKSIAYPDRSPEIIREEILDLVSEYCERVHQRQPFQPGVHQVQTSGRVFDASDVRSLVDSALEFWLTSGRFNEAFQRALAERLDSNYVITANSGSSANLIAFSALTSPMLGERAVKPGSEVITAATGFPTTVNPALLWGMTTVFVDVHIPTYNATPELVEEAITPKTRAIMMAHTLGNPFDADRISEIARRHDIFLIEDCCDALGTTLHGRQVGTCGDLGTLSFYPAHHITTGEGGAVFTDNPILRRAVEAFRDWGRDCYCDPGAENTCRRRFNWKLGDLPEGYDHKYTYSHLGFNLKMTDMQAAIGLSQLHHLDGFSSARRKNFRKLMDGMKELEEFFILPEKTMDSDPSWFGFLLLVRESAPFTRSELIRHLERRRIATRFLFGGNLVRQPYMKGRNYRVHGDLSNSDRIMNGAFWVGVYPGVRDPEISHVIETIRGFCRSR